MAIKLEMTAKLCEKLAAPDAFSHMLVSVRKNGDPVFETTAHGLREWIVRDTKQRGLLLRMTPGSATWYVQRRINRTGRKGLRAMGSLRAGEGGRVLTLDEARARAEIWRGLMADGIDPLSKKRNMLAEQEQEVERSNYSMRFAFEQHTKSRLEKDKPSTQVDRGKVAKWMAHSPLFGQPVSAIDKQTVDASFRPLLRRARGEKVACAWGPRSVSPGSMRKCFAYCSSAYKHASATLKLTTTNPFTAWRDEIVMPKVAVRETTFATNTDEGKRWVRKLVRMRQLAHDPKILQQRSDPFSADPKPHTSVLLDYYLLLLIWGTRLNETACLKWTSVDFESRIVWLAPETTKSSEAGTIPMTTWAEGILRQREQTNRLWRPGGEHIYVFPSRENGKPISNPRKTLLKLNALTGVDITTHDLRRVASTEMSRKLDMDAVSRLLVAGVVLHHTQSRGGAISAATRGYLMEQAQTMRPIYQEREDRLREIAGLAKKPKRKKSETQSEQQATIARILADDSLRNQLLAALLAKKSA